MASAAPSPEQQNIIARQLVLANSVKMVQSIFSGNVNVANNPTLNVQPRNVGLTLGFLVVVSGTVEYGEVGDADATRTPFGSANLIEQLTYTDLNNVNRIQTTGYHLALLNSARQGFVFGGAYAPNVAMGYGSNWNVNAGPASIVTQTTAAVKQMYWVPLSYSASDLRGAVYTNVVNATQNLQIVLNDTPVGGAAADPLSYVYRGEGPGAYDNDLLTVQVYQVYRDQIPFSNGIPILPLMDLNLVYDLKNTVASGMAANQDFPFAYPNMRQFLSTFAIYDNGGQMNFGTDVNYWSLESANSTLLFRIDPNVAALFARQTFMADLPGGTYYFDSRDKPIDTITFGNMTLNLNASTVNSNAALIVLTEAFQQVNQIPYASSLAIGS